MKSTMRALFALAVLLVGATSQLSCSVNDYCLNCGTDDGGIGSNDDGGDGGGSQDDAAIDPNCVPTGTEECDGKDNDCNGLIDDGVLPQVGDLCSNQMGACAGGVLQCTNGALKCSKSPGVETCNLKDDDCDGMQDEGDPGGGAKCGPPDDGECESGRLQCNTGTGMLDCIGGVDHRMDPESCNAKDDDCDGKFDEGVTIPGTCGPTSDEGLCTYGTFACQGGQAVCQNAVFPKFETCNNLDDDCDTKTDEVFDKQTDPLNCGTCGTVCPAEPNANTICATGSCDYACKPGYHDLIPGGGADAGCEYGPCFASGSEVCDGIDNDCDNKIDETLTPPSICRSGGECGATAPTATCSGAGGWTCSYPGSTQFPETLCDGKNNDCDANTDEGQSNLNQACDDGKVGECRGTGTYQCDASNLNGPATCNITSPGIATPAAQETCDNKDNDCDGKSDEGSENGNLLGQEWVDLGNGTTIMKYEASRFDSSSTQQGSMAAVIDVPLAASPTGATQSGSVATFTTLGNHSVAVGAKVKISGVGVAGYNGLWTVASVPNQTHFTATLATSGLAASGGGYVAKYKGACSKAGSIPWTNVSYVEAQAACESMGASLCTETRWHQACAAVTPLSGTTPIVINATTGTAIEAEDFFDNTANGVPESGADCTNATDDDGDGVINDGCPAVITGVGPESGAQCQNNLDDDSDGRVNDGCPATEIGTGPESGTQCTNNLDDDGDGRVNDGCPAFELGAGGESGAQCANNIDDDGDNRVNDGCPTQQEDGESGAQCSNDDDDDGDGRINDGCPTVNGSAETGTQCNNDDDNDGDGFVNDGCPVRTSGVGPETGNQCTNSTDNDSDGWVNDGCPVYSVGAGGETSCTSANDNDNDGIANDGCPAYANGVGPETGTACNNNTDDDGDGIANDGCPAVQANGETGAQCNNAIDDDGDSIVNDGCPSGAAAWIEDYTTDDPTSGTNEQHSGIGNMRALPNNGASIPVGGALEASPRLDYKVNIPTSGTNWRIHVRMFSPTGNDDTVHVGYGAAVTAPTVTLTTSANSQWVWMSTGDISLNVGTNTISLYMAEDGVKIDRIFIVRGTTAPPTALGPAGGTWSYASNPTTYVGATCNGADQSAANDNIVTTGNSASCYANHTNGSRVYDMSGNIKEWTLARQPGQNPIRGGASNDTATGISCALNFQLGSDNFFFPNVGFRCCK